MQECKTFRRNNTITTWSPQAWATKLSVQGLITIGVAKFHHFDDNFPDTNLYPQW